MLSIVVLIHGFANSDAYTLQSTTSTVNLTASNPIEEVFFMVKGLEQHKNDDKMIEEICNGIKDLGYPLKIKHEIVYNREQVELYFANVSEHDDITIFTVNSPDSIQAKTFTKLDDGYSVCSSYIEKNRVGEYTYHTLVPTVEKNPKEGLAKTEIILSDESLEIDPNRIYPSEPLPVCLINAYDNYVKPLDGIFSDSTLLENWSIENSYSSFPWDSYIFSYYAKEYGELFLTNANSYYNSEKNCVDLPAKIVEDDIGKHFDILPEQLQKEVEGSVTYIPSSNVYRILPQPYGGDHPIFEVWNKTRQENGYVQLQVVMVSKGSEYSGEYSTLTIRDDGDGKFIYVSNILSYKK